MSLNVLYLDDEPELCEAFVDNFSSADVTIVACANSDKALKECAEQSFDVIFLDYRLPGTNGDKIAGLLKPTCPTYLITGEISVATEFAFTKILPKPYKIADLESIILQHLHNKQN